MDGAEKVEDIQLFMDPSLLFSYFGLDAPGSYYNSFSYGFSSLEDAYKKIAGSTTFCLSAYDVNENLEYVGKPERLEYEAFRGFIEYLQTEGRDRIRRYGIHNWPLQPTELMKKQLEKTIDKYASKTGLVKQALARYTKRKLLRARFSGDVVMRATGLEPGNELGKFMEAYKKSFGSVGKFEFFVLSSGLETIADHVKAFYETWKNRSETEKVVEELVEAKSKNQEDLKNALNRSIAEYGPIVVNPHAVVTMTGI